MAHRHPPRGDGGDYAEHAVAWLREPGENGGTDAPLPQAGRAHGRGRLGAWAGEGPCRSRSQGTQTPNSQTRSPWPMEVGIRGQPSRRMAGRRCWHAADPYLACQLSVFGPGRALSRRVNLCCVLHNLDGDAKRIHEGLSWFGQIRLYVQWEEGEYCISLHRSTCVGVTSCERGSRSQVSRKRKMECCMRC
jgi:hypothetical protein